MPPAYESIHEAATALIRAGTEIFSFGDMEDAQIFFDASHALLIAPSSNITADKRLIELAREKLELSRASKSHLKRSAKSTPTNTMNSCPQHTTNHESHSQKKTRYPAFIHDLLSPAVKNATRCQLPDLYEPGECDVGPRWLNTPVCPTNELFYLAGTAISSFLEAVVMFNKGLICHSKEQTHLAEQHYNVVSTSATILLSNIIAPGGAFHTAVTELAMRACNNLGVLYYKTDARLSERAFDTAICFAKQLASAHPVLYNLEYATVLSNWCRIQYLRGEHARIVYHVQEVLRLRRTCLPIEHVDVAAAIWNVGAILYYTNDTKNATFHLMQYLGIASRRSMDESSSSSQGAELDAVPALVLLLMIQNKDRSDPLSQELVSGLCNLSDKRHEEGRGSAEVASILNYIGTILFHQQEYHHALVFFLEELRLEDQKQEDEEASSLLLLASSSSSSSKSLSSTGSPSVISVTCNNVGRIMQELGRYKEAVFFYQRSLKEWYGNTTTEAWIRHDIVSQIQYSKEKIQTSKNKNAVINLYSTVWYNLGLISDKVGSFDDAMYAFEMALALRQLMVGRYHADVACLLYNIGVLQMEKNRLDEASHSLIRALRVRNACDAGQLSNEHLVRTLQKLASLFRKEDHLQKALETYDEITHIQDWSNDNDELLLEAGQAWYAKAEIHHVRNAMSDAVEAANRSLACLRKTWYGFDSNMSSSTTARFLVAEQLIGCLLLQASLYHELAEPILAGTFVAEAAELARQLGETGMASLTALTDVTSLLSRCQCAAVA